MTYSQAQLPQLGDNIFLTDGGFETVLIFHDNMDLPQFAAFVLLRDAVGTKRVRDYYEDYIKIARGSRSGFILESPTWRASADWGATLGYNQPALDVINRKAIEVLHSVKAENSDVEMVVSGCIGPRGDGYVADTMMTVDEAEAFHSVQIKSFKAENADIVTALTMTYIEEALGITRAAQRAGIPVVISFTVETDGTLPSGQSLKGAIEQVDAATKDGPAYYMINCAHPEHFQSVLEKNSAWVKRIRGLRCNASKCSHAELDEAEELDDGDPLELGHAIAHLAKHHPQLTIFGGCCGTDYRHVQAMSDANKT